MIVQCEECRTNFNLDESLIKNKGSRVRCSVCKHVFYTYPPDSASDEKSGEADVAADEFERTLSLDLKRLLDKEPEDETGGDEDPYFEDTAEYHEDSEDYGAVSLDGLQDMITGEDTGTESSFPRGPLPGVKGRMKDEVPYVKKRSSPVLIKILLLVLLMALGGGAAVYFLAPEMIPGSLKSLVSSERDDSKDTGIRALSFEDVTGGFVHSEKAGRLFVVRGKVKNDYDESRRLILVRATILNKNGEETRKVKAYAGEDLDDDSVAGMSAKQISRAMKRGTKRIVEPGGLIPFTVIMDKLPRDMSEFTVEAVRSSPAE